MVTIRQSLISAVVIEVATCPETRIRPTPQHPPVIDENLLAGLYEVQAGDAPDQPEPRVVEHVRLAVWFKTVTNLTNSAAQQEDSLHHL